MQDGPEVGDRKSVRCLFCSGFCEGLAVWQRCSLCLQLGRRPRAAGGGRGMKVKGAPGLSSLLREEDLFVLPGFITLSHRVRSRSPLVLSDRRPPGVSQHLPVVP